MDPVTHALLGASVAMLGRSARARLQLRERALLGGIAALFPDIDFIGFPFDPLRFLADWHQGPTHSLVLLPLWAGLLGLLYSAAIKRREVLGEAVAISALALLSHIAADLITAYGVAVLWPLTEHRIGLGTIFVIDPLLFAVALTGALLSVRWNARGPVLVALAISCAYVGVQTMQQQKAQDLADRAVLDGRLPRGASRALAQPLSPFNWKVVHADAISFHEGHVNLAGHPPLVPRLPGLRWLHELAAAYTAPGSLVWRSRPRFGAYPEYRDVIEGLWLDARFEPFRRFAAFPALSRIDLQDGDPMCIWFTDLRYDLPTLPDMFRYGWCREEIGAPWELYRLRYFFEDARQRLRR